MRIVIDVEANRLENPDQIWVIVCKDIDTGEYHIFRKVTQDEEEKRRFLKFSENVSLWIGHNWLGWDYPVLHRLLGLVVEDVGISVRDTLILSKLIDYPREKHSIKDYGIEFDLFKGDFTDWSQYSLEMEEYCIRDVDICHKVYLKYLRYIENPNHLKAIELEHRFQLICNTMNTNGFSFNIKKAKELLLKVEEQLKVLDKDILEAFPPKLKLIREVTPKETKYGTISLSSIPKSLRADIADLSIGSPFSYCAWTAFNPSSHKQIIEVLNQAGWEPLEKTDTHKDTERTFNKLRYIRQRTNELDIETRACHTKLEKLKITGWKVSEENLDTLPPSAPAPARVLAKRIMLESRRRTLTEWIDLYNPDTGRIHGSFYGIGAWTHRMAHKKPNTANIPNEFDTNNKKKLYGKELRQLWQAPKNRLLVGVDAEGIQLRIFAHYVNNPELTEALVNGKKSDKTDPHSYNQRVLGDVCKSRQAAKRFLYALFLGAGIDKLTAILGCSRPECEAALEHLLDQYPGFQELKNSVIPGDAKRGWFRGLDGRSVRIHGETVGMRKHFAMSGYLQNGEAVVMKLATVKWHGFQNQDNAILVDLVHDEWQNETPNNMEISLRVAERMSSSLREVGEELNLLCPLAGSYWNDDHHDYTIGTNWYQTH